MKTMFVELFGDWNEMSDQYVDQKMLEIDKDGDGKISLDEYISNMFRGNGDESTEPDWVKAERIAFQDVHDVNGDGFMDAMEVKTWILPADYDHTKAEANHLIYESSLIGL